MLIRNQEICIQKLNKRKATTERRRRRIVSTIDRDVYKYAREKNLQKQKKEHINQKKKRIHKRIKTSRKEKKGTLNGFKKDEER